VDSRAGLVVSLPSKLARKQPIRVRSSASDFLTGSGVADSKCSESRGSCRNAGCDIRLVNLILIKIWYAAVAAALHLNTFNENDLSKMNTQAPFFMC